MRVGLLVFFQTSHENSETVRILKLAEMPARARAETLSGCARPNDAAPALEAQEEEEAQSAHQAGAVEQLQMLLSAEADDVARQHLLMRLEYNDALSPAIVRPWLAIFTRQSLCQDDRLRALAISHRRGRSRCTVDTLAIRGTVTDQVAILAADLEATCHD